MKSLLLVLPVVLAGCAMISNRPTIVMVDEELAKTKKLVEFVSVLPPSEIERRTLESGCGAGNTEVSSLAPAGPQTVVSVTSNYDFSVDHGEWPLPEGSRWIALRLDGPFHGVSSGAKLIARVDGGTDVTVFAADRSLAGFIKEKLEEGTIFCHWRDFDYPYD